MIFETYMFDIKFDIQSKNFCFAFYKLTLLWGQNILISESSDNFSAVWESAWASFWTFWTSCSSSSSVKIKGLGLELPSTDKKQEVVCPMPEGKTLQIWKFRKKNFEIL